MKGFSYDPLVAHDVNVGDRRLLFHIPTSSLFDLDPLSGEVLDSLRAAHDRGAALTADDLRDRLGGRYGPERSQPGVARRA